MADADAMKPEHEEFYSLVERFRSATDPKEVTRLGDELGRIIFGD